MPGVDGVGLARDPVRLIRVAIPISIAKRYETHVTRSSLGRTTSKSLTNSFVNVMVSARIPVDRVMSCLARSLAKSNAFNAAVSESGPIGSTERKETGADSSFLPPRAGSKRAPDGRFRNK